MAPRGQGAKGRGRKGKDRGSQAKARERKARSGAQEAGSEGQNQETARGSASDGTADNRSGTLVVLATPIGNLGDLSKRAIAALVEADAIVAEDTRVAAKLLHTVGVKKPLIHIDEHAADSKLIAVIDRVAGGERVVVTTDAGTPGVSDPGPALVDMAHERGVVVDAIPGPSAVTTALALSGFYAQRYSFLGYLPRKANSLKEEFEPYQNSPVTLVIFESPHRVSKVLEAALGILGDRRVCVCREMTKRHQQVIRGRLKELTEAVWLSKGEYTLVVEGRRRKDRDG